MKDRLSEDRAQAVIGYLMREWPRYRFGRIVARAHWRIPAGSFQRERSGRPRIVA